MRHRLFLERLASAGSFQENHGRSDSEDERENDTAGAIDPERFAQSGLSIVSSVSAMRTTG
jgi:hypothetical protein